MAQGKSHFITSVLQFINRGYTRLICIIHGIQHRMYRSVLQAFAVALQIKCHILSFNCTGLTNNAHENHNNWIYILLES